MKTHLPNKNKCHICGISYSRRSSLANHLLVKHSVPKPTRASEYTCNLCSYKTKLKFNLTRHHTRRHKAKQPAEIIPETEKTVPEPLPLDQQPTKHIKLCEKYNKELTTIEKALQSAIHATTELINLTTDMRILRHEAKAAELLKNRFIKKNKGRAKFTKTLVHRFHTRNTRFSLGSRLHMR